MEDSDVSKIILDSENSSDPLQSERWTDRGYILLNGVLYRYLADGDDEEAAEVVPKSKIKHVLHQYHDVPLAGHYDAEKIIQKIRGRYYWPGMNRTITQYVRDSIECQ